MNHPPILLVRSAQEQALCYQIVDSLGDLRLGESTQERDIPRTSALSFHNMVHTLSALAAACRAMAVHSVPLCS